eukprot:UN09211
MFLGLPNYGDDYKFTWDLGVGFHSLLISNIIKPLVVAIHLVIPTPPSCEYEAFKIERLDSLTFEL